MTIPNGNAINASVRKNVDRYEAMLMSGRREYFDEDDLLDVADYYYNDMSRKENALQCIEYALSLHPECLMALLMKAEIYFYSGKRDEAWLIIDSVSDRTDQDVLYYKGLFCLEEGKLEKADEFYKKAYFAQMGDSTELFCQVVSDYLEHNVTDGLDKWFDILPESLKNDRGVLEVKADYLRARERYKDAIAIEEKLIDSDPYNVVYWNGIAKLYCLDENFYKAQESIVYALDIDPNNTESLILAAEVATHNGNFNDAAEYYKRYLRIDDKNALVYYNYAQVMACLESYDEAIVMSGYALKYADEHQINKSDVYQLMSSLYWSVGDTKNSKSYLEEARKENKMSEEAYIMRKLSIDLKENKAGSVKDDVEKLTDIIVEQQSNPWTFLYILTSFNKYELVRMVVKRMESENPNYAAKCCPFKVMISFVEKNVDDFLEKLKTSVEIAPEETRDLFSGIFPEGLDVKDYYAYALKSVG